MALILVIKNKLLKRIDRASRWQQLSRIIDVEMIQKCQVAIFKMVQTESFSNEIKHLMSKKGWSQVIAVLVNWINFSMLVEG